MGLFYTLAPSIVGVSSGIIGALGSFLMGAITAKIDNTRRISYLYFGTSCVIVVALTGMMLLGCGPIPMHGQQIGTR